MSGTTQTKQTKTRSKFLFSQPDNAVLYDTALCKTAYQLYNILVEMANKKTHQVTVEVRILAERLGRAPITTRKHLSTLVHLGIIIRKLNKSKTNPKVNEASTFTVVGRHAKRYEYSEYAGDYPSDEDQKRQYPTVKNDTQKQEKKPIRESLESNLKGETEFSKENNISHETETPVTPTASISEKKPEKTKPSIKAVKYDLSGIPEVMRPVAEYLLMKTNRPTLRDSEREILRELDTHHTTARILKEINKCCERFENEGRDIQQLTFNYIGKILAAQDSRTHKEKVCTGNTSGENSTPNTECVQETLPDIASEIMPIDEAEKVISEYTPAISEQEGIPAALEELHEKIYVIEQENAEAFTDRLPLTEEGFPDWSVAEKDENGFPKIPQITMGEYLRLKFPEAEEEELRTDNVQDKHGLEEALRIDRTCALCCSCDGSCSLGNNGERPKGGRPVVMLKNHKLEVGYTTCIRCKNDKHKPDPAFETRVKRSGLSEKQKGQTFASYGHEGMSDEIVSAKAKAILSAKNGTSLILAGKAGTGKTHLATAIALEVMRGGKQALFISMPELLNEMRKSYQNHDFFNVRQKFYNVPCLVLDDLGKEKATEKGVEYLYQIIDYRYQHGMQTILTTNALNMNGLVNSLNANAVEPLISRIMENGEWVTIRTAKNYRWLAQQAKKAETQTE